MLAALDSLLNKYKKNPCKQKGSCKHEILSARTLCYPATWKALIQKLYTAESQNNPLRKCIIVGLLVVPLFNMATAAVLSHKKWFCYTRCDTNGLQRGQHR